MKNGIGSKLIDRRFLLGAAAGGSAVALLDFLELLEIGDTKPQGIVHLLRTQLADDPALPEFVRSASEAVRQHADKWSDVPVSARELPERSIGEFIALVKDDYKNDRTVPVLGWMISRTEAVLLTLM